MIENNFLEINKMVLKFGIKLRPFLFLNVTNFCFMIIHHQIILFHIYEFVCTFMMINLQMQSSIFYFHCSVSKDINNSYKNTQMSHLR
jgi:hypothetical protein